MLSGRNILFWCIDPVYEPFRFVDKELIHNCNYFIPVYCFDERMVSLNEGSKEPSHETLNVVNKVEQLRLRLRSLGSDLLIVNGTYDKMIPSLARVLQTGEVIALINSEQQVNDSQLNIQQLRQEYIRKTGDLLSRHSIEFQTIRYDLQRAENRPDLTFPPFPEIETGTVPQV